MKNILVVLVRIVDGLTSITGKISALCILVSAIIITKGVIARKVFNLSGIWEIELSVFLLIFSCFVGAAFVQKQDHHLNVDLFIIYLKPKTRELIIIITSIIGCILCGLFAWYAWPMWHQSFVLNYHSESYWGPPLWIPYFFLPFGMSLFFFQYLLYILNKIKLLRDESFQEEVIRSELKGVDAFDEQKK